MNITQSIADKIGGEIQLLIVSNPQIQFYANSSLNEYQWRDGRYESTCDVWNNPTAKTREELIKLFKEHLDKIK